MPTATLRAPGLIFACAAARCCTPARAGDYSLWLTSGVHSWHHNASGTHFRQNNVGIGLALEMPHAISLVAGTYDNSNNRRSNYFGIMFQPLDLGGVHVGALGGWVSGYHRRGRSDAVIPMASYEYKWAGINLFWYPGKVTAIQIKARVVTF